MPLTTPSETYAVSPFDPSQDRSVNRLWLMTCLGALDGTVVMLAAAGRMSGFAAALTLGLTVISGTGAWIAARDAFRGDKTGRDYRLLAAMAAVSIAATVLAAWLGTAIGTAATLHILPKAAGIVLFMIAAEVAGLKLPSLGRVPLPVLAIGVAALIEGVLAWIP